ncbi:hypothetical protein J6590_005308 [Homalodisca vitripennis]|nr:hypothetical protein J6590_005308 [Homalodisca vitripennis]
MIKRSMQWARALCARKIIMLPAIARPLKWGDSLPLPPVPKTRCTVEFTTMLTDTIPKQEATELSKQPGLEP